MAAYMANFGASKITPEMWQAYAIRTGQIMPESPHQAAIADKAEPEPEAVAEEPVKKPRRRRSTKQAEAA